MVVHIPRQAARPPPSPKPKLKPRLPKNTRRSGPTQEKPTKKTGKKRKGSEEKEEEEEPGRVRRWVGISFLLFLVVVV